MDGVGLVERAAVGLVGKIAADARRYTARKPEVHKSDRPRDDRRAGKEKRDRQEELSRRGEPPRLGKSANQGLTPDPLRVGEHRQEGHHRGETRDLCHATGEHRAEERRQMKPPRGRQVGPETAEERGKTGLGHVVRAGRRALRSRR